MMIWTGLKPLFNTLVPTLKIFIIAPDTTLMKLQTWDLKYQFMLIRAAIVKKRNSGGGRGFVIQWNVLLYKV